MNQHGRPHVFVTDKLRTDGAALKDLGLPDDRETGRWLNNCAGIGGGFGFSWASAIRGHASLDDLIMHS